MFLEVSNVISVGSASKQKVHPLAPSYRRCTVLIVTLVQSSRSEIIGGKYSDHPRLSRPTILPR